MGAFNGGNKKTACCKRRADYSILLWCRRGNNFIPIFVASKGPVERSTFRLPSSHLPHLSGPVVFGSVANGETLLPLIPNNTNGAATKQTSGGALAYSAVVFQ